MEFKGQKQERKVGMNEEETIAFLLDQGIGRIPEEELKDWKEKPLLWVVEDRVINSSDGPYVNIPKDKVPSIIRVDNPLNITKDEREPCLKPGCFFYDLITSTGQLDSYTINRYSGKPTWVDKSPKKKIPPAKKFTARSDTFFYPNDELFPPSGTPKPEK